MKNLKNKNIYDILIPILFLSIIFFYIINLSYYSNFEGDEANDISVAWSYIKNGIFGCPGYSLDGWNEAYFLHPPLPILIVIPLVKLFGITPLVVRLLPFIFQLGTIFLLYFLVKKLFDKKIAFWSVLFLAFNPVFAWRSFIFRPEVFAMFFIVLSFFIFSVAKERKNLLFYFLAGVTSSLSFLSHYYGAFLIISLGLYLLYKAIKEKSELEIKVLMAFCIGSIITLIPFFYWVLTNFEIFKIQCFTAGAFFKETGIKGFFNNCIMQEKDRYFKNPEILGMIGFTILGIFLFFKTLIKKMPEIIIFFLLFTLGLVFMPTKTCVYLVPISLIAAIIGGLMISRESDFIKSKFKIFIKIIASVFLLVCLFYIFAPGHYQKHFNDVGFNEYKISYRNLMDKHYLLTPIKGKIVSSPIYFLYMNEEEKEKFIDYRSFFYKAQEQGFNKSIKEENIQLFIFSSDLTQHLFEVLEKYESMKTTKETFENIEGILKEKGVLLGEITRSRVRGFVDYVYQINYE